MPKQASLIDLNRAALATILSLFTHTTLYHIHSYALAASALRLHPDLSLLTVLACMQAAASVGGVHFLQDRQCQRAHSWPRAG